MTLNLTALLTDLNDRGRTRVADAFVADPDLADGLARMIDGLPCDFQRTVVRRLAIHLQMRALGEGAFVLALDDALKHAIGVASDDVARAHESSKADRRS